MKKLALALVTSSILTLGVAAVAPAADATSWGCGGRPCRVAGR